MLMLVERSLSCPHGSTTSLKSTEGGEADGDNLGPGHSRDNNKLWRRRGSCRGGSRLCRRAVSLAATRSSSTSQVDTTLAGAA